MKAFAAFSDQATAAGDPSIGGRLTAQAYFWLVNPDGSVPTSESGSAATDVEYSDTSDTLRSRLAQKIQLQHPGVSVVWMGDSKGLL